MACEFCAVESDPELLPGGEGPLPVVDTEVLEEEYVVEALC